MLDATERLLVALPAGLARGRRLLRKHWVGSLALGLGERLAPGVALHLLLRKRWFWDRVQHRLATGVRQLVVLGAGFDGLGWTVAAGNPSARVIELDHPATQEGKRLGLQRAGAVPQNLHLVPVDLTGQGPWQHLAAEPAFDPSLPVILVAEGLVMYLAEERVRELLRALGAAAPGSELCWSWLTGDAAGRPELGRRGGFLRRSLARIGEPFRWGVPPGGEGRLLCGSAWELTETAGAEALRRRYPVPPNAALSDWERFSVARIRERP